MKAHGLEFSFLDPDPIPWLAGAQGAEASLRPAGSGRIFGELRLEEVREGESLVLSGIRRRESLPPGGGNVHVALAVGEDLLAFEVPLLAGFGERAKGGPDLEVAWPSVAGIWRKRDEVRFAAQGLPALPAMAAFPDGPVRTWLLKLGDRHAELGLEEGRILELRALVSAAVLLPTGARVRFTGSVHRFAWGAGRAQRLGLAIERMEQEDQEDLRRFLQLRRIAGRRESPVSSPAPAEPGAGGIRPWFFRKSAM